MVVRREIKEKFLSLYICLSRSKQLGNSVYIGNRSKKGIGVRVNYGNGILDNQSACMWDTIKL